jgi:pSer/pThr/pTyr-binding forkhead associated (FHA) protein
MHHIPTDHLEPGQPALLVTYGNTARKHRPLDKDVLLLGRAPNCDFCLVAPDISWVHCLVLRTLEGWRVRDCSGRGGTRVNGKTVLDAVLTDGDLIQLGSFCFQVSLPEGAIPVAVPVASTEFERLARSRRKLAQRALRLRHRLREQASTPGAQAALQQQAEAVQQRQRECDRRLRQLEQSERDLTADREALEADFVAFEERVERADQELREKHDRLEAELRDRRAALEEEFRRPHPDAEVLAARAEQLEQRARELDRYAEHLQRIHREGPEAGGRSPDLGEPMPSLTCLREELRGVGQLIETLLSRLPAVKAEVEPNLNARERHTQLERRTRLDKV